MRRRQNLQGNALAALLAGFLGVVVGAGMVLMLVWFRQGTRTVEANPPVPAATRVSPTLPDPVPAASLPAAAPGSVADAVARVEPAVVNIDTTVRVRRRLFEAGPFGDSPWGRSTVEEVPVPQGMGTGVLVAAEGVVLTNNHVIRQAQGITVTLADDRQFTAKVLGTDPITDLAILKIDDVRPFPVARLASSQGMRTGEWVVALGNPLGIGQTATVGVLSARGRRLPDASQALSDLLQTDAAINPGNSGGPLVNLRGEVIGINTAIVRGAQGIGFAVPAETAMRIMQDLQEHGRVVRPFLGIEMGDLTPPLRRYLELPQDVQGVVVGRILSESPAHRAGLKTEDLIVSVDGRSIVTAADLQARIRSLKVGQKVQVALLRQGKPLKVTVELQEMPTSLVPGR